MTARQRQGVRAGLAALALILLALLLIARNLPFAVQSGAPPPGGDWVHAISVPGVPAGLPSLPPDLVSPSRPPDDPPAILADPVPEPLPSDPLPGEVSAWPADGKGISGAVREALPRMKRCYEAAIERDPQLAGRITAHFALTEVDGVGRVTGLELETTTDQPDFEDCVGDVLAELAFDAPDDQVTVSYPLVFEATD